MSAADAQARVQALIDHRVASGDEVGVQVAVVEHGRVVVDTVSGAADPDRGRAVAPNTLFFAAPTARTGSRYGTCCRTPRGCPLRRTT
jgi:CubicO group peptidase (beta-lactamase class C family)